MLRKKCITLLMTAVIIGSFTACGKGKSVENNSSSGSKSDMEIVLSDENKEEPKDIDEDDDLLEKPSEEKRIAVNAAVTADSTGMGFAPIMGWNKNDKNHEKYSLAVKENPAQIVEMLEKGETDVAILPLDKAVEAYNNGLDIVVLATNTFNNIFIADATGGVIEKPDMAGKTIYYVDDNSVTSAVITKVLENAKAVAQPFEGDNEQLKQALIDGTVTLAAVPEPYITLARMSNMAVDMGPDVASLWSETSHSAIVTSVLVARKDFVAQNADAMVYIIDDFKQSINTVVHGVSKTVEWTAENNIIADKSLAISTLQNYNFTFTEKSEMKMNIENFIADVQNINNELFGGGKTAKDFYFMD